jgi:hypothetical protein
VRWPRELLGYLTLLSCCCCCFLIGPSPPVFGVARDDPIHQLAYFSAKRTAESSKHQDFCWGSLNDGCRRG